MAENARQSRRRYGENEDGTWSVCKAKPENVGKGRCHHVSHADMTPAEAQERNERSIAEHHGTEYRLRRPCQSIGRYGRSHDRHDHAYISDMIDRSGRSTPDADHADSTVDNGAVDMDLAYDATSMNDLDWKSRMDLAEGAETTVGQFNALSHDDDFEVRLAVASNTGTPASTLDGLAYDKDVDIRIALAGNESTSMNTLERLSEDPRTWPSMAENRNTPAHVLGAIADNAVGNADIRRSIERNPSTPDELLDRMLREDDLGGDDV